MVFTTQEAFCQKILAALDLFPQIFRMAPEALRKVLGRWSQIITYYVIVDINHLIVTTVIRMIITAIIIKHYDINTVMIL